MALAALVFTLMVVAVKAARVSLSTVEVTAWRSLVAVPIVLALGRRQMFVIRRKGLLALRCVLGFAAVYCFVTAASGLSVADLSLLHKLQPVWVAVLAPVFLGGSERPSSGVWLALSLGLFGSVLILQPGFEQPALLAPGLWAVAGAFFSGLAHISLRALGHTEPTRGIVFWFQFSLLPFSVLMFFAESGTFHGVPDFRLLLALAAVGVTAVVGQLLVTRAYQLERAARTAAASYTGPLWAYLVDYFLFDVTPTAMGMLGGCLVLASGLYLVLQAPGDAVRSSE